MFGSHLSQTAAHYRQWMHWMRVMLSILGTAQGRLHLEGLLPATSTPAARALLWRPADMASGCCSYGTGHAGTPQQQQTSQRRGGGPLPPVQSALRHDIDTLPTAALGRVRFQAGCWGCRVTTTVGAFKP